MAFVYHIYKEGDSLNDGYIGVSKNIDNRLQCHFTSLKSGIHGNRKLQEAYDNDDYIHRILLEADRDYCYRIERLLRPNYNMGLNIAVGGGGGHSNSISISKGIQIRLNKYGYVFGTKQSRDKMYDKINGTHPFIKKNRHKLMGNEFTSESSSKLANYRSSIGTLPGQVSSKNGTHHWFNKSHSERVSNKNSEIFTGTVAVTDKNGISKRITKEQFMTQQIGNREDWEYVGVSSKEAKTRRGLSL